MTLVNVNKLDLILAVVIARPMCLVQPAAYAKMDILTSPQIMWMDAKVSVTKPHAKHQCNAISLIVIQVSINRFNSP